MTPLNEGWSEESVAGHACDVYEPPSRNPHGFVLMYLHGVHLAKLRDHEPFLTQFRRWQLPVVAPLTQRSWWTDRICAEFDSQITAEQHVRNNIMPFIEERFAAKATQVGLLGTSMGGQGALRLAYKYPDTFPVVAAISPAIDYQKRVEQGDEVLCQMYEDPERARQDTATLHIHPLNWPRHQFLCCDPTDIDWFESSERLRMKLWSLGVPHEYDFETVAGGHGFGYYNVMAERAVQFVVDGLEKERRRV